MRIGELFAGYGGLGAGVRAVLGGDVTWVSEIDPGACKILDHRFPGIPNYGDITTINWAAVEPVDVLTGGFPCQDVSAAGKRLGIRPGTRSGLWTQFAYAIDQLRPGLVVIENVRGLLSASAHSDLEPCPWCVGDDEHVALRALGAVLGDLADLGYDASWQGLRAADVGAPHGRFRVFVTAWPAADTADHYGDRGAGTGTPGRRARLAPADADRLGHERSRRARVVRPGPANSAVHAADTDLAGLEGREPARGRLVPDGGTATHPEGHGRHEGRPEPARLIGGSDAAVDGDDAAADADRSGREACRGRSGAWDTRRRQPVVDSGTAWGDFEPAIRRWEQLTRPAPAPVEPSAKGSLRLSPRFVEWMMGVPAGWVTDVPGLSRNEQLKALGNGVCPPQAAAALRMLLSDIEAAA